MTHATPPPLPPVVRYLARLAVRERRTAVREALFEVLTWQFGRYEGALYPDEWDALDAGMSRRGRSWEDPGEFEAFLMGAVLRAVEDDPDADFRPVRID